MRSWTLLFLLLLPMSAQADVYTVGSSYTWDAWPAVLEDSPQYHIYCGRSLIYIYENPGGHCVTGSSPWPTALPGSNFGAISFQPVPAADSTFVTDLVTISTWLESQPTAKAVIHQTWPVESRWEEDLHDAANHSMTNRSLAYGYHLRKYLRWVQPGREIVLTRSNEMLDHIYHDCAAGACPFPGGFSYLFRDPSGHMGAAGFYVNHNALRAAFGQPLGVDPQDPNGEVTPEMKSYLDGVIAQYVPEPAADLSLLAGFALVGLLARRRRCLAGARRCSTLASQGQGGFHGESA